MHRLERALPDSFLAAEEIHRVAPPQSGPMPQISSEDFLAAL